MTVSDGTSAGAGTSAPISVALLSAAHVHAPAYAHALARLSTGAAAARLVAVWDDDTAHGAALAAQFGVPFSEDLDALLARPDLDAVVITAENARHRALCEAACAAGKHVLCEKPLATTAADAEAMIAAAARARVVLATAFPMRHNGPARAAKEAIDEGAIGRILAVRATNHGTLPPGWFLDPALSGGGAVLDHTVHVIDLLRWYLRDEPIEVYAETSHGLHGLTVEDAALLTVTFAGGVVVTLDPSWSRPPAFPIWGDVTMEISGDRGVLQLDAFARKLIYNSRSSERTEWIQWEADADESLIADFARAVRDGRPPAAAGRDGERALAVALAAYASARDGCPAPIALPIISSDATPDGAPRL